MSATGTPLSPGDLQRIRDSAGWRTHRIELVCDASAGRVLVKGRCARRTRLGAAAC
jgi:hypothetical protein